jgi:NitT/TauT family transport system substrate-binding protein
MAWFPFSTHAMNPKNGGELKVALLPILDSFPFYVAKAEGYFKEAGIHVTAVPVASALDRDQLMQSGSIDGMLTEMTTTASFNRKNVQVRIVRVSRTAYSDSPLFRVLAAPGSGISSPQKLARIPIGISKNTIIEYVTDRLLAASGLKKEDILKISVPVIPERYHLLMQGQIRAATLPDPLAKSALVAGALDVIDDSNYPHYSVSVLGFTVSALNEKPQAVRLFLQAWNRAAETINEKPEAFRPLLLKKIRVPKNIEHTYIIPLYPGNTVPDSEEWADVMDWMVEKGLLKTGLPYKDSVTKAFLP